MNARARRTVGGGASNFLIFLVPVPPRIADLSYDGQELTFIPRRAEFFPGLSAPVTNCLNKTIPARSSTGYLITMRFRRYVSPLEEINRILLSPSHRETS
jgi:hypothetical protein